MLAIAVIVLASVMANRRRATWSPGIEMRNCLWMYTAPELTRHVGDCGRIRRVGDTRQQDEQQPSRRRNRRRSTSAQGAPRPATPVDPEPEGGAATPPPGPAAKKDAPRRRRPDREAGLRDLVGSGHSQLGVSGALRGRDVNRPDEQDLADAERDVVIVRRRWTPKPDA